MFTIKKDKAVEESTIKKVKLNLFEKCEYHWIKRQIHKKKLQDKKYYLYFWFASQRVILQLRKEGFKCYYCHCAVSGTLIYWDTN